MIRNQHITGVAIAMQVNRAGAGTLPHSNGDRKFGVHIHVAKFLVPTDEVLLRQKSIGFIEFLGLLRLRVRQDRGRAGKKQEEGERP